jgi:hypothetical protein
VPPTPPPHATHAQEVPGARDHYSALEVRTLLRTLRVAGWAGRRLPVLRHTAAREHGAAPRPRPASAELRLWLQRSFSAEDAQRLYERCMYGRGAPLGAAHPLVACELAAVDLEPRVMRAISIAYMLLTAYYFLLDSGTDGHPEDPVDLADLTLLLSGAWTALSEVADALDQGRAPRMIARCLLRMSENAAAIRLEADQVRTWRERDEGESRRSIVGRSNSALLLYELVCIAGGRECDSEVAAILEDYLIAIQESDDLDDWRRDMAAGRWTPFLKRCAGPTDAAPALEDIARHVYIAGGYERQAARVIYGLERVADRLARHSGDRETHVLKCWAEQRTVRVRALEEWVAIKLRHSRAHVS